VERSISLSCGARSGLHAARRSFGLAACGFETPASPCGARSGLHAARRSFGLAACGSKPPTSVIDAPSPQPLAVEEEDVPTLSTEESVTRRNKAQCAERVVAG